MEGIFEELKPLLVRLNELNSRGSTGEQEHAEYLSKMNVVKRLLEPYGYTINWNYIHQEYGIAVIKKEGTNHGPNNI